MSIRTQGRGRTIEPPVSPSQFPVGTIYEPSTVPIVAPTPAAGLVAGYVWRKVIGKSEEGIVGLDLLVQPSPTVGPVPGVQITVYGMPADTTQGSATALSADEASKQQSAAALSDNAGAQLPVFWCPGGVSRPAFKGLYVPKGTQVTAVLYFQWVKVGVRLVPQFPPNLSFDGALRGYKWALGDLSEESRVMLVHGTLPTI